MLKGVLLILAAAATWGLGGVAGQYLFQRLQVDPVWLVTVRQVIAGMIFLAFAQYRTGEIFSALKNRFFSLMAFSFIGVLGAQLGFYYTISLCNAATATVLQYMAPVFVMLWVAYKTKTVPDTKEIAGIIFALLGVFLISTHGNLNDLVLSPMALIVGVYSAVAYAYYTLSPKKLLLTYSTATIIGWGQLLSGAFLAVLYNPLEKSYPWQTDTLLALAFLILGATIVSYTCYLLGLKIVGPTKASLISCAEPLSSIIAVVLLLDTVLTMEDFIGMGCIIFTVLMLSLPKK